MAELERLVAKIEGDMTGLRAELGKSSALIERHTRQMSSSMKRVDGAMSAIGTAAKTFIGVVGVQAFVNLTKSAMNYADRLMDVSAQTGIAVETLQELRFAAAQVGLEQASVDKALTKFTINLGQSVTIGGEYVETFQQLGVATKDASGNLRDGETVMQEVFGALSKIESVALRNALAYKLFGKEAGPAFAQFAAQGTAAINEQRNAARELGAVMSQEMVEKADKAADEMTSLGQAIRVQGMSAVADMSPAIVELGRGFLTLMDAVGKASRGLMSFFGIIEANELDGEIESLVEQQRAVRFELETLERRARQAEQGGGLLATAIAPEPGQIEAVRQQLEGINWQLDETKRKQAELIAQRGDAPKPPALGTGLAETDEDKKARDKATKDEQKELEARFEYEREYQVRLNEMRAEAINSQLEFEENARKAKLEGDQLTADLSAESWERMVERQNEADRMRLDAAQSAMSNLSTLMGSSSRKLFEVGKAAAIAETAVSTYKAAQDAYAWGTRIGGPPVGAAMAATAVAAGLARVQAIKATSFGSRSVGVGVGGGASVTNSTGGERPQTTTYIQLPAGQNFYSGDFIRDLIGRINDATGDGSRLVAV